MKKKIVLLATFVIVAGSSILYAVNRNNNTNKGNNCGKSECCTSQASESCSCDASCEGDGCECGCSCCK